MSVGDPRSAHWLGPSSERRPLGTRPAWKNCPQCWPLLHFYFGKVFQRPGRGLAEIIQLSLPLT